MDDAEVQRRARSGEDSRTEFKRVDGGFGLDADAISKALVAFGNSGGGDLFLGIADDGTVVGVGGRAASDALQRQLSQIAAGSITPPLPCRLFAIEVGGPIVVVASVPEFLPERPFRGKSKYFIRDGPSSREARPDELKRLLTSAPISYLDEQVIDTAARTDLDDRVITEFLSSAFPSARPEQTERYLEALHAIEAPGRPTVTGMILFGVAPERFLPGAYVSAIRFAGRIATSTFVDSRKILGDVFKQIRDTTAFLATHVPVASHVEGLTRVQRGVPPEVWREAITNAVTHRDHASPNQVRVFVFDDRVEIINPGELLNKLTIDNIRLAGTKQPRNPHVASAVARKGLRDNLEIGVPEIFRLLEESGLPEPQIQVEAGEFRLTVFTRV